MKPETAVGTKMPLAALEAVDEALPEVEVPEPLTVVPVPEDEVEWQEYVPLMTLSLPERVLKWVQALEQSS